MPRELLDADAVWELDAASLPSPGGVARALRVLADLLDPDGRVRPGATCGGVFVPAPRPPDLPPPGAVNRRGRPLSTRGEPGRRWFP